MWRVFTRAPCADKICGWIARTFNSEGEYESENKGKMLVINMVNVAINYGSYAGLVLHTDVGATHPLLTVVPGALAGLCVNYLLASRWVFETPAQPLSSFKDLSCHSPYLQVLINSGLSLGCRCY